MGDSYDFPNSPTICPVWSLRDYMAWTDTLRNTNAQAIFVSLMKPHKSVCAQTLAHWIKVLMGWADVDQSSRFFRMLSRYLGFFNFVSISDVEGDIKYVSR